MATTHKVRETVGTDNGEGRRVPERTRLLACLRLLREVVNPELPIQQLTLLLEVADQPGITYQELEKQLGIPHGSVSREEV